MALNLLEVDGRMMWVFDPQLILFEGEFLNFWG